MPIDRLKSSEGLRNILLIRKTKGYTELERRSGKQNAGIIKI